MGLSGDQAGPAGDRPRRLRTRLGVGRGRVARLPPCARGTRHTGTNLVCTLREVLVHARTCEAKGPPLKMENN